jgi:hypothetical protein
MNSRLELANPDKLHLVDLAFRRAAQYFFMRALTALRWTADMRLRRLARRVLMTRLSNRAFRGRSDTSTLRAQVRKCSIDFGKFSIQLRSPSFRAAACNSFNPTLSSTASIKRVHLTSRTPLVGQTPAKRNASVCDSSVGSFHVAFKHASVCH